MNFTDLEEQWIDEVFDDGTGYLDNSEVSMDAKLERGVISSLVKKGVIEAIDNDRGHGEIDLVACPEYVNLFE